MEIQYELSHFPNLSGYKNGKNKIQLEWSELIHAAITIGRRSWDDVLAHYYHSTQEMSFRYHMIHAFLKAENNQLMLSEAYKTLDPSEKGAVNYFIGMILTKVFASKLFDTNWLMHLDAYEGNFYQSGSIHITPVDITNKSRPDFVGIDSSGRFNIFEAKGRVTFENATLNKAHDQTKKIRKINGVNPHLKLGCVSYHNNHIFKMRIRDPEEYEDDALDLKIQKEEFFHDYYAYVYNRIFKSRNEIINRNGILFYRMKDECEKFTVGLEKDIYELLEKSQENKVGFVKQFNELSIHLQDYRNRIKELNQKSKERFVGYDGILIQLK